MFTKIKVLGKVREELYSRVPDTVSEGRRGVLKGAGGQWGKGRGLH